MYTPESYNAANDLIKSQLLWSDGVFLSSRKSGQLNVFLYKLFDFYVELFFENEDEPFYLKAFSYGQALNVYIREINLPKFSLAEG